MKGHVAATAVGTFFWTPFAWSKTCYIRLKLNSCWFPTDVSYHTKFQSGINCEDCNDPVVEPRESQYYYLNVTDDKGCVNRDSIFIEVIIPNDKIYIPNAFSPNNDGENDRFYVRGLDVREMEMQVLINSPKGKILTEYFF